MLLLLSDAKLLLSEPIFPDELLFFLGFFIVLWNTFCLIIDSMSSSAFDSNA